MFLWTKSEGTRKQIIDLHRRMSHSLCCMPRLWWIPTATRSRYPKNPTQTSKTYLSFCQACLRETTINFDKWLQDSSIPELEILETTITNNPVCGNMPGYLKPYLKLLPVFKNLQDILKSIRGTFGKYWQYFGKVFSILLGCLEPNSV